MAKAKFIPCSIPKLTPAQAMKAAERAREENPARWPANLTPGFLAVDVRRWWVDKGKVFTVDFVDTASNELRKKVLLYANAWSEFANVKFVDAQTDAMVRVSFGSGGYWSFLGTDILGIPKGEPTMNLERFTVNSPESEWKRVVKHEFGHTLGFPHEHMRAQLVAKLDPQKTIRYFRQTQGWSANEVRQQVLTPLSQSSIRGTPDADDTSIMCYQLPGSITTDGKPIRGGSDINALDAKFIATIYPKATLPPVEPPAPGEASTEFVLDGVRYRLTKIA